VVQHAIHQHGAVARPVHALQAEPDDWKAVFLWKALYDAGVYVNVAIYLRSSAAARCCGPASWRRTSGSTSIAPFRSSIA
jgi:hypothetical protein